MSFRIFVRPLLVLTCALAIQMTQQPARAQGWSGGIRIGSTLATLTGQSDTNFGYTSSLAGGAQITYRFTPVVGLQSGVIYAQRGGTTDNAIVDGNPSGLHADVAITYIDIPLLVVARLPVSTPVVPSFFAGGAFSNNIETLITLRDQEGGETRNSDDSIASIDLFGVLGGTLDFDVAGQRMVIDVRATLGIKNVRPERSDAPLHNTSFILMVGLDF